MVVDPHQDNQPLEEDMWKCRDYMIRPASQDEPHSHGTSQSWDAIRRRGSEWRLSRFSVLLVKTGDDAHLSEPISFQPLFDKGLVLPPMREDCLAGSAVRVRLDTEMEFVGGLIRREEEPYPMYDRSPKTLRTSWMPCARSGWRMC